MDRSRSGRSWFIIEQAVIVISRRARHVPRRCSLHIGVSRGFGFCAEPVIGPRSARTRWRSPGTTMSSEQRPMTSAGIEKIFRDEAGRALATLIRLVGDFDLAQDALQDAFATALERWRADDPPSNPR